MLGKRFNDAVRKAGNSVYNGLGDALTYEIRTPQVGRGALVLSTALLAGCASEAITPRTPTTAPAPAAPTAYSVPGQITGSSRGAFSNKDTPYSLEVITLFGKKYLALSDALSGTGFSLSDLAGVTQGIDPSNRTVNLETAAGSTLVAVPAKGKDGKPASTIRLQKTGPYAIKARFPQIDSPEPVGVTRVGAPDFNLKTVRINGKEYYTPIRQLAPGEEKGSFYTIGKEGSIIKIAPDGQISIVNPRDVNEWVLRTVVEKQVEAKKEKDRKAEEKRLRDIKKKQDQEKLQGIGAVEDAM